MTDQPSPGNQTPQQPQQQRPQGRPYLPTQQATNFAMSINPNGILVGVGQPRAAVTPSPTGPSMHIAVEWVVTLALNPVAAVQLAAGLTEAIKVYESTFGKIPQDPAFKMTVAGGPSKKG